MMQSFEKLCASSSWFFIGYWILQRGWVSTRPLFFLLMDKIIFFKSFYCKTELNEKP